MEHPFQTAAAQRLVPGLVGMATPANGVYLRALQSAPVDGRAELKVDAGSLQLNRLRTILYELDFGELLQNVCREKWRAAESQIATAAVALKAAGAQFLVITSNTGNTLAQLAAADSGLPILDIVRPALAALRNAGCRRAGLIGTPRTLQSQVYQSAGPSFDVEIMAPAASIAQAIERTIVDELVYGKVTRHGLASVVAAARWFADHGADGLILGCTDMTHLATELTATTPLYVADTTIIHAAAAARAARSGVLEWTA